MIPEERWEELKRFLQGEIAQEIRTVYNQADGCYSNVLSSDGKVMNNILTLMKGLEEK